METWRSGSVHGQPTNAFDVGVLRSAGAIKNHSGDRRHQNHCGDRRDEHRWCAMGLENGLLLKSLSIPSVMTWK